jgi:hypothetical protein
LANWPKLLNDAKRDLAMSGAEHAINDGAGGTTMEGPSACFVVLSNHTKRRNASQRCCNFAAAAFHLSILMEVGPFRITKDMILISLTRGGLTSAALFLTAFTRELIT